MVLKKSDQYWLFGNDSENGLKFVDITYAIISSSAQCGKYDIELSEEIAKTIGLNRSSVIKTTKIYTGSHTKLGNKIGDLPTEIRNEFKSKYEEYQRSLMSKWENF